MQTHTLWPSNQYKVHNGRKGNIQVQRRKNLGIAVHEQLKFQQHINLSTRKANQRIGMIKRSFTYMDNEMFLNICKSTVRSHLEYGTNVWSVINKKKKTLKSETCKEGQQN